ncbi:MAG TPA: ComEC/Rec2 family competence protein, partial [Candidatus Woesebacteria bacterium]|nr:ComEC/Rec2 family competence protein [Candidatus Woesebacteria bacterium]
MEHLTSVINTYLPEPHASLLNGIVLGVDLQTTYSFKEKLKDVGLIHIVVLSGMNITLLSAVILQIIIPLFGRKIATIATIVSIIVFIWFVGIDPPIVRAGIMGILSLIGL